MMLAGACSDEGLFCWSLELDSGAGRGLRGCKRWLEGTEKRGRGAHETIVGIIGQGFNPLTLPQPPFSPRGSYASPHTEERIARANAALAYGFYGPKADVCYRGGALLYFQGRSRSCAGCSGWGFLRPVSTPGWQLGIPPSPTGAANGGLELNPCAQKGKEAAQFQWLGIKVQWQGGLGEPPSGNAKRTKWATVATCRAGRRY